MLRLVRKTGPDRFWNCTKVDMVRTAAMTTLAAAVRAGSSWQKLLKLSDVPLATCTYTARNNYTKVCVWPKFVSMERKGGTQALMLDRL